MRADLYLPWVGPDGTPSEQDERDMRIIWYLSRDIACHSARTLSEAQEAIYRLVGYLGGQVAVGEAKRASDWQHEALRAILANQPVVAFQPDEERGDGE